MCQKGSSQVASAFGLGSRRLCPSEERECRLWGWSVGWVAGSERLSLIPMPHLVVLHLPARDRVGGLAQIRGTGNSMGTA